jgi:hypothetical protein
MHPAPLERLEEVQPHARDTLDLESIGSAQYRVPRTGTASASK